MTERARRIIALTVVIAVSATIVIFRRELAGLAHYGYPGLTLVSFLSSATVFLPVPGIVLVCATGTSFIPALVGLAAGSGAAIGECTGYLAGYAGRGVIENRDAYERIRRWMERYGVWVILGMAVVPNPVFDIAGVTAGILRIPLWMFLLAAWIGNVLKATVVALACAGTINVLSPLIERWLGR